MTYDDTLPNSSPAPLTTDTAPDLVHANTPLAAQGMAAIAKQFSKELTAVDMLDVLQSSFRNDHEGAGMMFTQSQVLDALFHRLTLKAMSGVDDKGAPISNYVEEEVLDLALKAQKQCRVTVEALHHARTRAAEQEKLQAREKQKNNKRTRNDDYGW